MIVMAKRRVIRTYARHKKCGHVMEPFDLEVNKDSSLRLESDGTAILEEAGRVPRLAGAKKQVNSVHHMLKQAARQTRCLHCNENVVLTSADDAVILDLLVREIPTKK
jgi:hypothetical protein